MIFLYIHDNTHTETHINKLSIFGNLSFTHSSEKKMFEAINMQNTDEKQ